MFKSGTLLGGRDDAANRLAAYLSFEHVLVVGPTRRSFMDWRNGDPQQDND